MSARGVLLLALLGACQTEEATCDIACGPSMNLAVLYPTDADPETARVEVCRNTACVEGPLPVMLGASTLVGEMRGIRALAKQPSGGGSPVLEAEVQYFDTAQLSAGDGWSLVVRDRDGVVLAQKTWSASYRETSRCGDDRPGDVCVTGDLAQ